jgi:hypothetical protein
MKLMPDVGFKNYYAGDDGFIYSMKVKGNTTRTLDHPKRIYSYLAKNGYLMVRLYRGGRGTGKTVSVHSLVCEAFYGPRPEGKEVCHGGVNRQDNRPENLSWGTHTKNLGDDCLRDGTHRRGERQGSHKLTERDVVNIFRKTRSQSQKSVADEYKVSQSTVSNIVRRKRWSWLNMETV